MGVQFDRVLERFNGPFEKVTDWNLPIPSPITGAGRSTRCERVKNDCFIALNRLFKNAAEGRSDGSPILANPRYFGVGPDAEGTAVRAVRIGLWDQYGGSMESGWTRWILEQFEFPFSRVFAPELDAGNLNAKYDVLVFVSGAIPAVPGAGGAGGGGRGGRGGGAGGPDPQTIPAEYRVAPRTGDCAIARSRRSGRSSRMAAPWSRSATRR